MYILGINYNYGFGVEKNKNKAIYWYKKAAEQGHEGVLEKLEKLIKKNK